VSFTRRFVRTSTRRTDSSSSVTVMKINVFRATLPNTFEPIRKTRRNFSSLDCNHNERFHQSRLKQN
jgi:hypothetical protein